MSGSNGAIIGAPNLRLINTITQFLNGSQAVWNNITIPIPLGLVVYAIDTTAVKIGDGVTLYADLPVWFTLNSIGTLAQEVETLMAEIQLLAPINSPSFTGTPTAPTQSANDSSIKLATTAYTDRAIAAVALQAAAGITQDELTILLNNALIGVESSATPLMDGIGSVGVSAKFSREDHVHPSDTSRAPLDSPALTGTPTAPTLAFGDKSTKIATTAFVDHAVSSAELAANTAISALVIPTQATNNPLMDGTVSVGTSARYAREDHVHPSDTTRAPLISPVFTGTPKAPTQSAGDNSTNIATTAYTDQAVSTVELQLVTGLAGIVIPAQATATPLMDGSAVVGSSIKYAREDHVHPTDTTRASVTSIRNRTNGNVTLYVNTSSGNDTTGDGSSANPFASVLRAQNVLLNNYDLTWGQATINKDGTNFISVKQTGGMRYAFSTDSYPAADVMLLPGDQCAITINNIEFVYLCIASVEGLYRMTVTLTADNTTNCDIMLHPNNQLYTDAFLENAIETTDLLITSLPADGNGVINISTPILTTNTWYPYQVSPLPIVSTNLMNGFYVDNMSGPYPGVDTQNDIGPSMQRWDISTFTVAKHVLVMSGTRGGISSIFSKWLDTTTPWTSLGMYQSFGGTAVSGVILIERLM